LPEGVASRLFQSIGRPLFEAAGATTAVVQAAAGDGTRVGARTAIAATGRSQRRPGVMRASSCLPAARDDLAALPDPR
jgi:hypothetical protein